MGGLEILKIVGRRGLKSELFVQAGGNEAHVESSHWKLLLQMKLENSAKF